MVASVRRFFKPSLLGTLMAFCLLVIAIDGIPNEGLAASFVGGLLVLTILLLIIDRILVIIIKNWIVLLIIELLLLVAVSFIFFY